MTGMMGGCAPKLPVGVSYQGGEKLLRLDLERLDQDNIEVLVRFIDPRSGQVVYQWITPAARKRPVKQQQQPEETVVTPHSVPKAK